MANIKQIDLTTNGESILAIEERMDIIRNEFESQLKSIKSKFANLAESSPDKSFESLWKETKNQCLAQCVDNENLISSTVEDAFQDLQELMDEPNFHSEQDSFNIPSEFQEKQNPSMEDDDDIVPNQIQANLANLNWDGDMTVKSYLTELFHEK